MIINNISRRYLVRYFCDKSDTSDTSDTSKTANSSDTSKISASGTRLSSYFILFSFVTKSYRLNSPAKCFHSKFKGEGL